MLYHVTSHPALATARPGDVFTLIPGPQGAEGRGVYFSEDAPRITAAEGVTRLGYTGIVAIATPADPTGWWRSKGGKAKKFGKPRTWHTDGRTLACRVQDVRDGVTYCEIEEEN